MYLYNIFFEILPSNKSIQFKSISTKSCLMSMKLFNGFLFDKWRKLMEDG